jgi:hypothetical protein
MSDFFEAFLSSLSDEQKEKLAQSIMNNLNKPAEPKVTADLEREEVQELGRKRQPAVVVNEDFTVTRNNDIETRKQPVRARKNQWVDTGEDVEHDKDFDPAKFEKMGRTARSRPKSQKVEMTCYVCGKSFKTDPKLVYGEFVRCNRCTGR